MQENAEAFKALSPLTSREQDQLHEVVRLFKDAGPIGADLSRFQGLTLHGAPVTGITASGIVLYHFSNSSGLISDESEGNGNCAILSFFPGS